MTTKNLNALVVDMARDPKLAAAVIADPRKYKDQYNLSESAMRRIKALYLEDFKELKPKDPESFARGATVAAQINSLTIGDVGCYYGG